MISFNKGKLPQLVIPWIYDDRIRALCALCYMAQCNPRIKVIVGEDALLWVSKRAAEFANEWFDLDLVPAPAARV